MATARRPWGRITTPVLALATVAFLCLGSVTMRAASAQQSPDCEDPDTIACIPIPSQGSDAGQSAQAGVGVAAPAGAAVAAPAAAAPGTPGYQLPPQCIPPYPPPYPYPYPGPPLPYAPGAPAAAAAPNIAQPVPAPCYADIYSTINRANLTYARAMRSLDPGQLSIYWGQDALQDLLSQIRGLSAAGSYRVLRLRSIQVVDQSFGYGTAFVHTREHWTVATWSFDGYQYDANDAWYDNQYYLYRAGGRWIIGTDVVN